MRRGPQGTSLDRLVDSVSYSSTGTAQIGLWIRQGLFLTLGAIAVYLLMPQILDVMSTAPRLLTIRPWWFVVMAAMELASFVCIWWLTRIVLPKVSWFVASTSQVVANAVSRVVPGGAAVGGATYFRMLSVSGVGSTEAAGAMAATSILSTAALFAIPATGLAMALLGAPVPESLWPAAVAGGVLFVSLVGVGVIGVRFDKPLLLTGKVVDKVVRSVSTRLGRPRTFEPERLLWERDRLVAVVGHKWLQAIAAAAGNWAFDYLALIAALYAVGADPRLSIVLLAYAGAAVLAMIPITPGGFGFVEAGLASLLVISGISAQNALLATLAYRIVSLWIPLLGGVAAWIAFRRRYRPNGNTVDRPAVAGSARP